MEILCTYGYGRKGKGWVTVEGVHMYLWKGWNGCVPMVGYVPMEDTYGIDVYLWKEYNSTHCSSSKNVREKTHHACVIFLLKFEQDTGISP